MEANNGATCAGAVAREKKILIVDDEEDIRELVGCNLSREGYLISAAETGEKAIVSIKKDQPDLIVLDLMLPGIKGLEVLNKLKTSEKYAHIPVVILSAKGDEVDIVTGLEMGAADYVSKPFSPRVLIARVKSVLRRLSAEAITGNAAIKIHGIEIDPLEYRVTINKKVVELTHTEFELIHFLASKPSRVFTRSQIIDGVKGEDYPATDRSVDVQIVGLRKKLGNAGKYIKTIRGVGYKFEE